jgi:hypothetical protein
MSARSHAMTAICDMSTGARQERFIALCAAGPGTKSNSLPADLSPDEEINGRRCFILAAWSGNTTTSGVRAVSFLATIRQVENLAKRIDSRSGDPNMRAISTQGA